MENWTSLVYSATGPDEAQALRQGPPAVVRVALPLVLPQALMAAVLASAVLWSAGFGLYAVRYWSVLTGPRLDGRPG